MIGTSEKVMGWRCCHYTRDFRTCMTSRLEMYYEKSGCANTSGRLLKRNPGGVAREQVKEWGRV